MVNWNRGNLDSEGVPNHGEVEINDLDANDDEGGYDGYEPLGMHDYDEDANTDSNDEQDDIPDHNNESDISNVAQIESIEHTMIQEVWSAPVTTDIPLDENKINQIKELMRNITLPTISLPEWVTDDDIVNNLILKTKVNK